MIGKDLRVTDPVRTAVAAAQASGVYITLATGRIFRSALPFARQLGLRDPLICYQGALIRHPLTHDVLHHAPLPGPLAAEAIALLHGAGTCVIACIDERLGIVQDGIRFAGFVQRWGSPDPTYLFVASDLAEIARATPPTKLMFFGDPPLVERELAGTATATRCIWAPGSGVTLDGTPRASTATARSATGAPGGGPARWFAAPT